MTAPALYRYVASYQELVDLVAFEIDKAATETLRRRGRRAARGRPRRPAGRRRSPSSGCGRWPTRASSRLAFANPIADAQCVRRELLTTSCSGHLMTDQMRALWEHNHHPVPGARRAARRRSARPCSTR